MANEQLNKLSWFRNLSQTNKRKLYLALVQSTLLYPIVPLNILTPPQMSKLQKIQNKGTRFITNTRLIDRISSRTLHEQCNLQPINTIIHNRAYNTWSTIQTNLPHIHNHLTAIAPNNWTNNKFPSSKHKAEGDPPVPRYT